MAEFCKYCESEETVKKRIGKWWLIPVAVVLTVMIVCAIFWKPLLLRFAPKVYLSIAFSNTMDALEEREEGSPTELLKTVGECMNKGTMVMEQSYYGYTASTVTLRSDMEAKRWALDYRTKVLLSSIETNLYMDGDCLAVQIPGYTGGTYYGLTYDSFGEDLKNSVLGDQLSDEEIQSYEQSIQEIDDQIDGMTNKEILDTYIALWTDYCKNLNPGFGKSSIEIDHKDYNVHTVAYTLTVEEMLELMDKAADQIERDGISFSNDLREALNKADGSISGHADVIFYIYDMQICAISFHFDLIEDDASSPVAIDLMLRLGLDPASDDMVADIYACLYGYEVQLNVTSSVDHKDGTYKNTVWVDGFVNRSLADGTIEQSDVSFRLSTSWNSEKGILEFYANNTPCTFEVTETESGIEFVSDDLFSLMDTSEKAFGGMIELDQSVKISFSRGCEIDKPAYTNLDQIKSNGIFDIFGNGEGNISPDHSYENTWIPW